MLAVGCGLADTSGSTSYYTWTANDTSATVTGYTGTAKTLAIPGKLNGKPVTDEDLEEILSSKQVCNASNVLESLTTVDNR